MKVKLTCPECGNYFFIDYEDDIMKFIIELDKIGYPCLKCGNSVIANKNNVSYLEYQELRQEEHLH